MACDTSKPVVLPIAPGTNDKDSILVVDRYIKLMEASVGDGSIYERFKNTIMELSKELNLTELERAKYVSEQLADFSLQISASSMGSAVEWAKVDATIGYETALLKEKASQAAAETELVMAKICTEENQSQLTCANIEAVLASSIRENGKVATRDKDNPCHPTSLEDEGLKYQQTRQVQASTYEMLADAYRKSGVVEIGFENGMIKGINGDRRGHTYAQEMVARRQEVSFEDSKRNHVANSTAQTIGQLIAAEAELSDDINNRYTKALDYLLSDTQISLPGEKAYLDYIPMDWKYDTIDGSCGSGNVVNLTSQSVPGQITVGLVLSTGSNVRNGDSLVLRIDSGAFTTRHKVTVTEEENGTTVALTFPSVTYASSGDNLATMVYTVESYAEDVSGNTSVNVTYCSVQVQYNPSTLVN